MAMRVLFVILVLFFVSCSPASPIEKQLAGSDSLVINFNEVGTNNIAKTVTTSEVNAIKKLSRFIDGKDVDVLPCNYDGNLEFFKQGIKTGDFVFNFTTDSCRHFIQDINGTLSGTSLGNEAANFLKSLAEGKDWY